MKNFISQLVRTGLLVVLTGWSLGAWSQNSSKLSAESFQGINFRFIGPGQTGGRISDIEVHPHDASTIFFSASTGGIFKTTDGGLNWIPIFDQAGGSLAIGDLAISPKQPDLIWAGTGEASGEQSAASVGDGVYKSVDGGQNWSLMGLEKTRHISRICIDPNNPETVFIAATGARWGENEERGIYKTTDGGTSWSKVLYVSSNTGFSDLVLHPDGQILLASAWQQRRNAWAHVQKGPESGLYRSTDGGTTWNRLSAFPDETIGRIALWMTPSDPNRVYACLESDQGGLYRSNDAGLNWELVNSKQSTSYWYGRLYGSPANPDHLFVMGTHVNETLDGGKTFVRMKARNVHVDHHVLWINPENENHQLLGNDGGLYRTDDGGENWTFFSNFTIGQYYAISLNTKEPYSIYGGLQDNGVWGGPSRSESEYLVTNKNIQSICGGDGFYSAVYPFNQEIVFGESQYGYLVRRDLRVGSYDMVAPKAPQGESYRFNWNTPFFISSHPPYSLYLGGNKLFKSADLGQNWEEISGDLSKNVDLKNTLVLEQKPVLKPYASLTALAESPLKPGLLLAGTDDGKLHLTLDDGKTWEDLTKRLPMSEDRFFTRVLWSADNPGTAYVACARFYEANDLKPYLFKTKDFGETWMDLSPALPEVAVIKSLAEHPANPNLLFAGTHNDLLISLDAGLSWIAPDWNLPPVGMDDIKLAFPENDLVLGSYGRGLIILDAIGFLSEIDAQTLEKPFHLFQIRPEKNRKVSNISTDAGPYDFHAPDPENGFLIQFLLTENPAEDLIFQIFDVDDQTVFTENWTGKKGFNRRVLLFSKIPEQAAYVKLSYKKQSERMPLRFKD